MGARTWLIAGLSVASLGLLGGATAQGVVELRLWHQEQPPQRVKRIQEIIDAFNKANPAIHVKQEVQNWGDVYQKALSSIKANAQPDILFTIPDFTLVVKSTGAVQPVTSFVKTLNAKHKFLPAALEPYSYGGQIWAVPLYGMTQNLWYRADLFRAANLQPPKTWDDLLADAKALTKNGVYGIGLPASKSLYTDQVLYNFLLAGGAGQFFNTKGDVTFNTPATVKALDFYKQLWAYAPKDATSWTWGEAEAALASGTTAMIFQFTSITSFDTQSGKQPSDLGVVPMPVPTTGGRQGSIFYANAAMILAKDAKKRAAAQKFLTYLMEPETYGRFLTMEAGLFLPVTTDGQTARTFWSDPLVVKYRPQVDTMIKASRHGALFGFTEGRVFPKIGSISAQNLLAQVVQQLIVSNNTPEQAAKWGQDEMDKAK